MECKYCVMYSKEYEKVNGCGCKRYEYDEELDCGSFAVDSLCHDLETSLYEPDIPEGIEIEIPVLSCEGKTPTYKVNENVFEITCVAMELINNGKLEVEDSRELCATCIELAENFEVEHGYTDWDVEADYLDEIMKYAEEKLMERYS